MYKYFCEVLFGLPHFMSLTKLEQHKTLTVGSGADRMGCSLPCLLETGGKRHSLPWHFCMYNTLNLVLHFKMSKINETNSLWNKLASLFFFFCRQIHRSHSVINSGLVYCICLAYGGLNHLLSTMWPQEYFKKNKILFLSRCLL